MRGNPRSFQPRCLPPGSIPACAGEPPARQPSDRSSWVYPRVCGGTDIQTTGSHRGGGLSPRVRGNHVSNERRHHNVGSIPACAGEPVGLYVQTAQVGVYPRVCGGTRGLFSRAVCHQGLSPRVRGNPRSFQPRCLPPGSIPACAGEPLATRPLRAGGWVYPRVCGGTYQQDFFQHCCTGLSPRVRGNHELRHAKQAHGGSIPACAGEPSPQYASQTRSGVYPRVCGGTIDQQPDSVASRVYPRVCGGTRVEVLITQDGSIPACAGEPLLGTGFPITLRVYPRVCGGTFQSVSTLDR